MTKAAFNVMVYLDRYLTANAGKRAELFAFYEKQTGKRLDDGLFGRHRKRKVEPGLSASLVYLMFLSLNRELGPEAKPGALFTYKNPKYLKP